MDNRHYHLTSGGTKIEAFVAKADSDHTIVCARIYNPPHVQCAGAVVEGATPGTKLYRRCVEDAVIRTVCEAAVRADVGLETTLDALNQWFRLFQALIGTVQT